MSVEAQGSANRSPPVSGTTISNGSSLAKNCSELTMMPGRLLFGSQEPTIASRQFTATI